MPPTREEMEREEEALCAVLEASEDLLQAKLSLQEAMKEGWFNLARARYHMGPGAVGSTQYASNMTADVRLRANADAGADAPLTWSLTRVEQSADSPSELRQRARRASKDGADAATEPREPRPSALSTLPQAPMRMFASMPPPALRAAQQHFWRALECVVDAANAHARLAALPAVPQKAVELRMSSAPADADAASDASSDEHDAASAAVPQDSGRVSEVDSICRRFGLPLEDDDGVTSSAAAADAAS